MSKDVILTELCSGAWAIPPSMLMKSHDNDYYTCSKCGKPCEYKETEVSKKLCMMCDEPIGDMPWREVKTLKRFGQVLLQHGECPKVIVHAVQIAPGTYMVSEEMAEYIKNRITITPQPGGSILGLDIVTSNKLPFVKEPKKNGNSNPDA